MQPLSVHSFKKCGDALKQVPLCFVLMSRRKKTDYEAVFNTILGLMNTAPDVEEIVVDFEKAVWTALGHCMPAVAADSTGSRQCTGA